MNIAIVIENFHLAAGGNERSTAQIARHLVQRGHQVTILTNRADADSVPGATVVAAGGLSTKYALGLRRFRRWAQDRLSEDGFETSLSMTTAVPARVLQPRAGLTRELLDRGMAMQRSGLFRALKRVQLAVHAKRQTLLRAERATLHDPAVRKIVAISYYVIDQLTHHYQVARDRIELIPNAVEIEPASAEQRARARVALAGRIGATEGDPIFLFAGMDPKRKGLEILIHATRRVHEVQPNVHLVVVGAAPSNLVRLGRRLGLGRTIHWLGRVDRMDALYMAVNATILPSWCDSSGRVILESLLHGTPAISTLHAGAAQWIYCPSGSEQIPSAFGTGPVGTAHEHPAGCVIRRTDDAPALAQAMMRLSDPTFREACSAATAGLDQRITMRHHVDQLERLLESVAT